MHSATRFLAALALLACCAFSQSPPEPAKSELAPPIAADESFFPHFQITPLADGKKVVLSLDSGDRKLDLIVEPIPPKDGGETVQWVLYANGGGALYTKKTITLPGPDGGTPVEGIIVSRLSAAIRAGIVPPAPAAPVPAKPATHQSSSEYTTPPKKSEDFKLPLRAELVGHAMGRPRLWLKWDGKNEVEVEPVQTKFRSVTDYIPVVNVEAWIRGNINHMKYLSNISTVNSVAPRYFYMKRNGDDSMTVYGDDDIDKLKAIEKKGK